MKTHIDPAALLVAAALLAVGGRSEAAQPRSGFNAQEMTDFSRGAVTLDVHLAGAADAAERLRAGMVLNPPEFIKKLSPLEQLNLFAALGPFDLRSATHTAWFFRGASRVMAGEPSMPIVTFYNPFADVALVTSWRRIDAAWWMTSAVRLDGALLRGSVGDPWWRRTDQPYAAVLAQDAGATVAAAGRLTDDSLSRLQRQELPLIDLARRNVEAEGGLAAWVSNPQLMGAYEKVRAAIASAQPKDSVLPVGHSPSPTQLRAVRDEIRRSMTAIAAFQRGDGKTVALSSPLKPELILFADFNDAASPALLGVTPVNLLNAALVERRQ
jgi:hypothetical protein